MKKEKKIYNFVDISSSQSIIGWLTYLFYFILMKRLIIGPMLSRIFEEKHSKILAGPTCIAVTCIIFLVIFKDNIRKHIDDFLKAGVWDNVKWILKGILFFYIFRIFSVICMLAIKVSLKDRFTEVIIGGPENEKLLDDFCGLFPLLYAILALAMAPVLEELVFRYLIYHTLRTVNKYWAIIGSSLLFTLAHVVRELMDGRYIACLYYSFSYISISLLLAILYEKRRNLILCMIIHSIHNTVSFLIT